MKRQVDDGLKLPHSLLHHGRLMDFRKSHVHIQHIRPVVLLADPLLQDIFQVVVPQGLLELGLAGGVYALPDNDCLTAGGHCLCIGGHHSAVFFLGPHHRHVLTPLCHQAYMLRGGSAAPSHHHSAHGRDFLHDKGKALSVYVVHRLPVLASGKACIGVYQHGKGGHPQNFLQDTLHLHRPQTAVDAQGIHPQSL